MDTLAIVGAVQNQVEQTLREADIVPHPYDGPSMRIVSGELRAKHFDHTLLKPETPREQFLQLCREAQEWNVAAVCVPPNRLKLIAQELSGSDVLACAVLGFPLGYDTSLSKALATKELRDMGCREFDMVIALGLIKDNDIVAAYQDVRAVVEAAEGLTVKVILETALLNEVQKITAGVIARLAGAAMLKTSTGFAATGATVEDVRLLRIIAGDRVGVKAAGGIRTVEFAENCISAGADRLGASATGKLLGQRGAS